MRLCAIVTERRGCETCAETDSESVRDSYSPRSFTSGRCSLGGCDDIQTTGMCIFIRAGGVHCGYRRMAHFSAQTATLAPPPLFFSFFFLNGVLQETNKQRYKVVRVGG